MKESRFAMDRLYLMSVFIAVAEEKGFAGGARRLGVSPPTVTRAVATLEEHLGVKLFNRSTRFVRLSEAGQRYLEDARSVIAFANEADQAVLGVNADPRGTLSVTASALFGRMYVMPVIIDYMKRHPAMEVSAMFVDRVVNIVQEGFDVAIRIGELPDSSLKARKVASVRRVFCASPAYLAEHGTPRTPQALAEHRIIVSQALNPTSEWRFLADKRPFTLKLKPNLALSDNISTIDAAVNGLGITSLFSYMIKPQLATGSLHVILEDHSLKPVPVHIVHNEGRYVPAKTRAFIDQLVEHLRSCGLDG
jgi:DNA-binding transcriptional LysR family regulator